LRRTEEEVGPDLFQAEGVSLVGLAPDKQLPVVVDGEDMARRLDEAASATTKAWVLIDSSARGGTGRPPSWARLAQLTTTAKMILAGGLNEENVTEVMSSVRPFGVDVSSGIESSPGVKDPERMRSFVAAARSALPLAGGHS
jgi:phosphoribosylanthranilate isomerase